jgi:hypothetical protein
MIAPSLKLKDASHAVSDLNDLMCSMYFKDPKFVFHEIPNANKIIAGNGDTTEKVCHAVRVWHGYDVVGELRSGWSKRDDGNRTKRAISIISKNIKKERRPYDEITTSNPKAALRDAMKYFRPPSKEEISLDIRQVAGRYLDVAFESVDLAYMRLGDAVEVAEYFVALSRGEAPRIPVSVEKAVTEKVTERVDNYSIVKNLKNLKGRRLGYGVELSDNGHVRVANFADMQALVEADSIQELPEWMMLKITMLKMLGGTQAIRDVGCRFSDTPTEGKLFMYITEGEMTHLV